MLCMQLCMNVLIVAYKLYLPPGCRKMCFQPDEHNFKSNENHVCVCVCVCVCACDYSYFNLGLRKPHRHKMLLHLCINASMNTIMIQQCFFKFYILLIISPFLNCYDFISQYIVSRMIMSSHPITGYGIKKSEMTNNEI